MLYPVARNVPSRPQLTQWHNVSYLLGLEPEEVAEDDSHSPFIGTHVTITERLGVFGRVDATRATHFGYSGIGARDRNGAAAGHRGDLVAAFVDVAAADSADGAATAVLNVTAAFWQLSDFRV